MKSKLVDKDEIKTILKNSSQKVFFRVYYESEGDHEEEKEEIHSKSNRRYFIEISRPF